jgi:xanthine dehydrogenase YagS FAD-binding subunit
MNEITVYDASSITDANNKLAKGNAEVLAGGTDLVTRLRGMILPKDPKVLVNLKTIPKLDEIKLVSTSGMLKIGSLATLNDIAESKEVKNHSPALAQAAESVGGPELRNMGTIGGNICQYVRCWYYRTEYNVYNCKRKGGAGCYAVSGDNRYHSIFGYPSGFYCYAVNPSDIAPVLITLGASIKTNKKTTPAKSFFSETTEKTTTIANDEFVIEIQLPEQKASSKNNSVKSYFTKFAIRKSIDFAIVSCATFVEKDSMNKVKSAVIWLNGVYMIPKQAAGAEKYIIGKQLNDANATTAGQVAFTSSQYKPLSKNAENKWIIQALIKKALVECGK